MVLEALASGRRWGTQGPRNGPMAARRNLTARGHRKTLGMLDPTEAKRELCGKDATCWHPLILASYPLLLLLLLLQYYHTLS